MDAFIDNDDSLNVDSITDETGAEPASSDDDVLQALQEQVKERLSASAELVDSTNDKEQPAEELIDSSAQIVDQETLPSAGEGSRRDAAAHEHMKDAAGIQKLLDVSAEAARAGDQAQAALDALEQKRVEQVPVADAGTEHVLAKSSVQQAKQSVDTESATVASARVLESETSELPNSASAQTRGATESSGDSPDSSWQMSDANGLSAEAVAELGLDDTGVSSGDVAAKSAKAAIKPKRPRPKPKQTAADVEPEPEDEPQQLSGWRARAAALVARALGREPEKPKKTAPKKKRAARKKTAASAGGVSAKPRAKRKPRAAAQSVAKKGLFGRVLASIGIGAEEAPKAPRKPRKASTAKTEGRTAPRKPRAAGKKRAAKKVAPAKKGFFGRVFARFGNAEEEITPKPKKPRAPRKPADPNAPKKPRAPRAAKKRTAKKAVQKTRVQRAVDSVVGGWRALRGGGKKD